MFSKHLLSLAAAALVIPAAFAQTSQTSQAKLPDATQVSHSSETKTLPIWVGPMRRAPNGRVRDGAVDSTNWSGYAVTGTGFTVAKGSWIVPTGTCSKSPNSLAFFWVGIDGYSSSTVEQAGTATLCNKTTVSYWAWYEFYPASSVEITSLPVKPGDKISSQITYKNSEFTLEITDETTGKSFSITQAVSGAERNSAEWIAEAPTVDTGIVNLSDFTKVEFGDDYTDIKGTNSAEDSTVNGDINAFGANVEKITQIDFLNYVEATPSALSTDGTSFTSTWDEYN